jgi:hypothetical protein
MVNLMHVKYFMDIKSLNAITKPWETEREKTELRPEIERVVSLSCVASMTLWARVTFERDGWQNAIAENQYQ